MTTLGEIMSEMGKKPLYGAVHSCYDDIEKKRHEVDRFDVGDVATVVECRGLSVDVAECLPIAGVALGSDGAGSMMLVVISTLTDGTQIRSVIDYSVFAPIYQRIVDHVDKENR